jgi:hypothetical protein
VTYCFTSELTFDTELKHHKNIMADNQSPLKDALEEFSTVILTSRSEIHGEIEKLTAAGVKEKFNMTTAWVTNHGWKKLSESLFSCEKDFSHEPLSLIEVFPLASFMIGATDYHGKVQPVEGLHSTNFIEKSVEAAVTLIKYIQDRGWEPDLDERQFFELFTEFFTRYIQSIIDNNANSDAPVRVVIGTLIERVNIVTRVLQPVYDLVYTKRDTDAYATFEKVNQLLSLMVRWAGKQFVEQNYAGNHFPVKWMQPAMDLINEHRYGKDLQYKKFEYSQKQALGNVIDGFFLFGEKQRQLFSKYEYFSTRIHSIKATKLGSFDNNGLSDPYVVFSIDSKVNMKTSIQKKELNPTWTFSENDEKASIPCGKNPYVIKVIDWDLIGKDEVMCEYTIDFAVLRAMLRSVSESEKEKMTVVLKHPEIVDKEGRVGMQTDGDLTIVISFEKQA